MLLSYELVCYEGTPGSGLGKWKVVFYYDDGRKESFDGVHWKDES